MLRSGGVPVYADNYKNGSQNYLMKINPLLGFKGVISNKKLKTFSGNPEFTPEKFEGIFLKGIDYRPLGC